MSNVVLNDAVREAQILGVFKNICRSYELVTKKNKLRNIMSYSPNKSKTVYELVKREQNIVLEDKDLERLIELIKAFLNKSIFRSKIDELQRKKLLHNQNYECAICHYKITEASHVDHIIPFKYVGDELKGNWQMLCSSCNKKKRDSIDYQIKVLLNLI